jgi:hypothetical protein
MSWVMLAAEIGSEAKLPVRSVTPVFGTNLSHGSNVALGCGTIKDFFSSKNGVHDNLSVIGFCSLF